MVAKMEVDIYSAVKLDAGDDIFVRAEAKNRRPYVARISLSSGERKKLKIPTLKREEFASLGASGAGCPRGTIYFSLYGEKRTLKVPFSGRHSFFPLRGDGEARLSEKGFAIYEITFKSDSGKKKKIELEFESGIQTTNLCDRL